MWVCRGMTIEKLGEYSYLSEPSVWNDRDDDETYPTGLESNPPMTAMSAFLGLLCPTRYV